MYSIMTLSNPFIGLGITKFFNVLMIITCLQSHITHTRLQIKPLPKSPVFHHFHSYRSYTPHRTSAYIFQGSKKQTKEGDKREREREMKDRIQRCVALPFTLGCSTQSSVAVADTHDQPKKPDQLIKSTFLLLHSVPLLLLFCCLICLFFFGSFWFSKEEKKVMKMDCFKKKTRT